MDKLLIIGASGLLWGKLCEYSSKNYEVRGIYNAQKAEFRNMHQLDVAKRTSVFKLFDKVKPELVVNTHEVSNIDYRELHPGEAWAFREEFEKVHK